MPANDHENRLTRVETICSQSIPRIEKFMEEGHRLRSENSGNIATILEKVISFEKYQEACDKDRKELADKVDRQGKALTSVQSFQRRQVMAAGGMGTFAGFLVVGGAKVLEHVLKWFEV